MQISRIKALLAPLAFAALAACGGTSTYVAYPQQPQAYVAPTTSYVVQPAETVVTTPTTTYIVPSETIVTAPTTTYVVPPPQPPVRACPWGTYTC